jgi:hypothetical protein
MVKLIDVYKKLAPSNNIDKLEIKNQSTNDIINQVLSQHIENKKEAKKIAYMFDGGNIYDTSKNIWNFLKYEVPYKVEPSDKQTTKTISRMLFDALNGKGNDCKHYAGFTGAILDALGYQNWRYRFAGYSKYINVPTHVYCYAKDNNGIIYIDAVINGFDLEKPFVLNIDKKINNNKMSLYKLSGFDNEPYVGNWFSDKWKAAKKAVNQAADFVGDKARQAANFAKETALKAKQALLTASLAIPRNAFLLLLRFNVRGWATGLQNKTFDQLSWWVNDWGGNRTELMAAIKKGAKEARILGFNDDDILYPSMVGGIGEPVSISAALATATPIIVKIQGLLDSAQKVADKVNNVSEKTTSIVNTVNQAKKGFEAATGKKVEDIIWKKDAGQTGDKNSLNKSDLNKLTDQEAKKVGDGLAKRAFGFGAGLDTKTMLLIGGVSLAALLILKKK